MQKSNSIFIKFIILMIVISLSAGSVPGQDNSTETPPKPCTQPEASQFDFWLGEWELSWEGQDGQQGKGTNKIYRALGGCVIHENFAATDGSLIGQSWSMYVPRTGEWKQTWVDNQGSYLLFTGKFEDGKMELRTAPFERNGKTFISRMVFKNITENSLNWDWQRSEDNGATWVDVWNIQYKRKAKS